MLKIRNPDEPVEGKTMLVKEVVLVAATGEGFPGSWHLGTVIHHGKLKHHVRYENVLVYNGLNHLTKAICYK